MPTHPVPQPPTGAPTQLPPVSSVSRPQRPATPAPRPVAPAPPAAPAAPAALATASAKPQSVWAEFFQEWPEQIPRRGILISQQNEASPFKGFMLQGGFLLLERVSPDSLGGRFVLIPYEEIASVKFTDPLKQDQLEAAGFAGKLS